VQAGWWVDGIQILCREPSIEHPHHGGTGGGANRFDLQPGERIVAVSGWTVGNSGAHVYGIEVHTDRRSSGMLGNGGDDRGRTPFRFDVPAGWELRGIVGRADGSTLQAIGIDVVHTAPPPAPVTQRLGPVGGGGGAGFEDACPAAAVIVNAGWWIDGIQVVCASGRTMAQRGGTGGGRQMYQVPPGARITGISGRFDGSYGAKVYSIQIHTDQGSSPLFGGGGPDGGQTPYAFRVPDGYTFSGFFGRAGDALGGIGIVVVSGAGGGGSVSTPPPPPPPPPVVVLPPPPPPPPPAIPPRLASPQAGQVMDNGCDGSDVVDWRFTWGAVNQAAVYHLWVAREGSANPMINQQVGSTEYAQANPGYIANHNLGGWSWRVRAQVNGTWSEWSESRPFGVEPLGTDCGGGASAPPPERPATADFSLIVRTGTSDGAGTDSNIYVTIHGSLGNTGEIRLNGLRGNDVFERGANEVFTFPAANVGTVTAVVFRSDGQFMGSNWQLDAISLRHSQTGGVFERGVGQWLDGSQVVVR
jgi:hypothetical protein